MAERKSSSDVMGLRAHLSKRALALLASALLVLLALVSNDPAHATASLSFEGDGYWMEMEIGDSQQPVTAKIRFHSPGDKIGVVLSQELLTVTAFDPKRQTLSLRYAGGSGVAPFALSVRGSAATLDIGSERVQARFSWAM